MSRVEHHWSCLAIGGRFIFRPNLGETFDAALIRARKIASRMQVRRNRYYRVVEMGGQIVVVGVVKGQHLANWMWHAAQVGECFDVANVGATTRKKVSDTIRYWFSRYNRTFVAEDRGPVICVSRVG